MKSIHGVLIVCALIVPQALAGQARPEPGDRVRVTHGGGDRVVGTLSGWVSDTLWVAEADGQVAGIPLAAVEGIERSLARERRFAENLFLTAGVMALVGGTAAAVMWSPCTSTEFLGCLLHPESRTSAFGFGAAAGGIAGIPVGILVGLNRRHDRWAPVEVGRWDGLEVQPVLGPRPGIVLSLPIG